MTLAEKVGQLNLTSRAPTIDPQRIGVEDGRIGGVLNVVHPDEIRQLRAAARRSRLGIPPIVGLDAVRSEEHTSELQSRLHLVCRLLLEKKKKKTHQTLNTARNSP